MSRHIGTASGVYGNTTNEVVAASTEVGGKDQGRASGIQLRDDGIPATIGMRRLAAGAAAVNGLERAGGGGKVGGIGIARQVSITGRIYDNAKDGVVAAATKVRRIDQRCA